MPTWLNSQVRLPSAEYSSDLKSEMFQQLSDVVRLTLN